MCMEPFFPLLRNVVHACGFTGVQNYTDQDISLLSGPYLALTSSLLFRNQKLHFNIKTQKHYCSNHIKSVFFLPEKILLSSISLLRKR